MTAVCEQRMQRRQVIKHQLPGQQTHNFWAARVVKVSQV